MTHAMDIAKHSNFPPATAARFYAYVASAYADTLERTQQSSQAALVSQEMLNALAPSYQKNTNLFIQSLGFNNQTLLPAAQDIVQKYKNRMKTDHFDLVWDKKTPVGKWYIRNNKVDGGAMAGRWTRWILEDSVDFSVPAPPKEGSISDLLELEKIRYATERVTPEDMNTIFFWHGASGFFKGQNPDNITPAGVWQNLLFVEEGNAQKMDDLNYAQAQKLLAQALADSFIITWQLKYTYYTKRPSMRDKNLDLIVADPPFPGYVSGHSTISKTAAVTLSYLFPEKTQLWHRAAKDARTTRLLAGIHYDVDNNIGEQLGEKIGQIIVAQVATRSRDTSGVDRIYQQDYPLVASVKLALFRISAFKQSVSQFFLQLFQDIQTPKPASRFIRVENEAGIADARPGGGAAWGDYDNDGYLDLVIPWGGIRLFKNDKDGTFTDVTDRTGLTISGTRLGAATWADYDNDGNLDLFVAHHGSSGDDSIPAGNGLLFHNNGDQTFTDVTKSSHTDTCVGHGEGVAWNDYNHDGNVDLFVVNYGIFSEKGPVYQNQKNCLFHNNGNGTFTDVASQMGIDGTAEFNQPSYINKGDTRERRSLPFQPVWFDYNNDNFDDLFVTTDLGASPLYRNNGDSTFTDVTQSAGLNIFGTNMGVSIEDFDGNGFLDIYVTNVGPNSLWKNNGDGTFTDVAQRIGATRTETTGWGATMFDFDNDGDMDIFATNGVVDLRTGQGAKTRAQVNRDVLFEHMDDGTYRNIGPYAGTNDDVIKRGAAFGDYDNNGFVDILTLPKNDLEPDTIFPPRLHKNLGNNNHWLTIKLVGTKSNRSAIGAKITVTAGKTKQIREISSGSSYLSGNSLWLTFGLGTVSKVDSVIIQWPSGTQQQVINVKSDTAITITED